MVNGSLARLNLQLPGLRRQEAEVQTRREHFQRLGTWVLLELHE
jgi:hypothetical protein